MAELGSSWTRSACWKSIHFPPSLPSPTWRSVLKEKTLTSLTVTASVQIDFTARCLCFQFRYKRRVYTQSYVDDKQLAKLHTKVEMCNQNKVQTQFSNSKFVTTSPHSLHWESCCSCFSGQPQAFYGTCSPEKCGEGFQMAGERPRPKLPWLGHWWCGPKNVSYTIGYRMNICIEVYEMCLSLSLCVHVSQSVLWLWPSSWRRAVNSSKSCVAVALIWTSGPGTASRLCTERFSAGTALHSLWGYNVVFCGLNWPQGGSSRQAAPASLWEKNRTLLWWRLK